MFKSKIYRNLCSKLAYLYENENIFTYLTAKCNETEIHVETYAYEMKIVFKNVWYKTVNMLLDENKIYTCI